MKIVHSLITLLSYHHTMAAQRLGIVTLLAAAAAVAGVQALSTEEWQEQSVYALITDRFARDSAASSEEECQYRNYCGGTWKGVEERLDYIQGMGFTAIWISPIVKQIEAHTKYGCVKLPPER